MRRARDEYSEARGAVSRATELLAAPAPHYGISRHEVINFFRNGSGTALLTRNYDGAVQTGETMY